MAIKRKSMTIDKKEKAFSEITPDRCILTALFIRNFCGIELQKYHKAPKSDKRIGQHLTKESDKILLDQNVLDIDAQLLRDLEKHPRKSPYCH